MALQGRYIVDAHMKVNVMCEYRFLDINGNPVGNLYYLKES